LRALPGAPLRESGRPIGIVTPVAPGGAPQELVRVPRPLSVSLETGHRTNEFEPSKLRCDLITLGRDGADTTAQLSVGLDAEDLAARTAANPLGERHFAHWLDEVTPDRRVRVTVDYSTVYTRLLFQGFIETATVYWDPNVQRLSVRAISEGQELLRTDLAAQIVGRAIRTAPHTVWQPGSPDDVEVAALPAIFNADGRPNRSRLAYDFQVPSAGKTFRAHLFAWDGDPNAKPWTAAQALRHIIVRYVLRPERVTDRVDVSGLMADTAEFVDMDEAPDTRDPYVNAMASALDGVTVQSQSAEEAINAIVRSAPRLHYDLVTENAADKGEVEARHTLRVYTAILDAGEELDAATNRKTRQGRPYDLPREAPFADHSALTPHAIALANKAQGASLSYDRREINAPIVLGGIKEYEVTLLLRPGWLPHPMLDDVADAATAITFWDNEAFDRKTEDKTPWFSSHHLHGTTEALSGERYSAIGRRWVFPDSDEYMYTFGGSPYARGNWPASLYNPLDVIHQGGEGRNILSALGVGGGVLDARLWTPRSRPFLATISRVEPNAQRAPLVEVAYDADDPLTAMDRATWRRYVGQVTLDPLRGAITLTEDDMFHAMPCREDPDDSGSIEMFAAIINRTFALRVTCVIRGDARLRYDPLIGAGSVSRARRSVIDTGLEQFRFRKRTGNNSVLAALVETDPEYMDRDDTAAIQRFAVARTLEAVGDAVAGSATVPWLDDEYRLGDSFKGCAGLALSFRPYAEIVAIDYVNDSEAGQRTELVLADTRDRPEVGSE
jgi:hypothetical protein